MKKILSILASIAVIAAGSASMTLTASADAGVVFEVGNVSTVGEIADGVLVNDETVVVPVNVTENQGFTAFLLEFTQADDIQVTDRKSKDSVYRGAGTYTWNPDALCLLWTENSCQDTNECGLVANLIVTVPAGTPVGTYEIGFEESTVQVTNTNFDSLEFSLIPGGVQVGGDPSQNPPVVTEAPETVTQAPETTKLPAKATQPAPKVTSAPEKQTEAAVTTVKPGAAAPANDNSAAQTTVLENAPAVSTAADEIAAAVNTTAEETAVTGNASDVKSSESAAAANNSSSKTDSKKDNSSSKKSSANKTSDSPSTGVKGIALPAAFLAVSTVGVIAASKIRKK